MKYSDLKKDGFLPQRQDGWFSLRLKVLGGRLESEELALAARLAETYGRGYVHLTVRQSLEIPFIKLEDIETVKRELAAGGLRSASLGPGLRTMTACPGSAFCPNGLTAPQDMVEILDRELNGEGLPHKFKIGVTGCHNNCVKAEENDIGLRGALVPIWARPDRCTFCGRCQRACPAGAITVTPNDLRYDPYLCVHCGRCFNKCPEGCWNGRAGWHLFFGGLFGNDVRLGRRLLSTLTEDRDILAALDRALDFYRREGRRGERFGRTLKRVGWEPFEEYMQSR